MYLLECLQNKVLASMCKIVEGFSSVCVRVQHLGPEFESNRLVSKSVPPLSVTEYCSHVIQ